MNEVARGLAHERAQKILDEVSGVAAQYGINSKSLQFLRDLVERKQRIASPAIDKWLRELEHKAFVKGNGT